jgi:hypothetical protein
MSIWSRLNLRYFDDTDEPLTNVVDRVGARREARRPPLWLPLLAACSRSCPTGVFGLTLGVCGWVSTAAQPSAVWPIPGRRERSRTYSRPFVALAHTVHGEARSCCGAGGPHGYKRLPGRGSSCRRNDGLWTTADDFRASFAANECSSGCCCRGRTPPMIDLSLTDGGLVACPTS